MAVLVRLGVDTSNWTGALSAGRVADLKAAGVSFAIVGTQRDYVCRQHIGAFEAADVEVAAVYCFLYWDGQDHERVQTALDLGKPVWLDCEYKTGLEVQALRQRIHAAVNQCGAQCAGIYTGSWWWQPQTANYDGFKDLPLWHAAYQARPDSLELPQPYGGWTKARVWQYSSGGIAGLNVDVNVMEEAPAPVTIAGVGAHYTDGGDEEIWTPRDGRELDGIGVRMSDGAIRRVWP